MSYKIKNTDGTTLLLLGDGKIDSESVSITLVGKNYSSYGEIWNNNLIQLMGNFANPTEPSSPIKGQLWYDSFNQKLNVYDETWEPLNGSRVQSTEPATMSVGDFWFNSVNNQLYIKSENGTKLVGPAFPSSVGSNGWVLPTNSIQDATNGTSGNVKQVTLLRNYGTTLGYVANENFNIATTVTNSYITATTVSAVKGLTILGNVRASEIVYANTLTVTSSIVYPESERVAQKRGVGELIQIDNLIFVVEEPQSSQYVPKIYTATGTEKVVISGTLVGSTGTFAVKNNRYGTPITTTPLSIGGYLENFADSMQLIVTKATVSDIVTYRVSVQVTPTNSAPSSPEVFSICIEKILGN